MKTRRRSWTTATRTVLAAAMVLAAAAVSAMEYYDTYFHPTGPERFDEDPMVFGEMSEQEAKESGSYTAVEYDSAGNPLEAVSVLEAEPNYYYRYYYDNERLQMVQMEAVFDDGVRPLSEVVYSYDDDGGLESSAYYTYAMFGMSDRAELQYLKVYRGRNYQLFDYTVDEESELADDIEQIRSSVDQIAERRPRSLLQRLFGW